MLCPSIVHLLLPPPFLPNYLGTRQEEGEEERGEIAEAKAKESGASASEMPVFPFAEIDQNLGKNQNKRFQGVK